MSNSSSQLNAVAGPTLTKYKEGSWDFRNAETKYSIHGFHAYPAMMIPQIAQRLILTHSQSQDNVLDPFCGSGTVLAESKLTSRNSMGIDINPLALLLSKVKTIPLDPKILTDYANKLFHFLDFETITPQIPSFFNIDYWFKPQVIKDLAKIKLGIFRLLNSEDIRNFFLVCFSWTVRIASNTRNTEFKLFRISPNKLQFHNPNTFKIFRETVTRNIKKMDYFYKNADRSVNVKIYDADTREDTPLPSDYFHLLVTSPPYGDSRTTVAYGQFSRLSHQWLGLAKNKNIDKESLGGIPTKTLEDNLPSGTLHPVIERIGKIDTRRAKDVLSFYVDLNKTLTEIYRVMRKKSIVCFVMGNRSVKGIRIPSDKIIVDLFRALGFRHLRTITRNIPNKTMPLQNSPSNIPGDTHDTMHKENIVIVQKLK